MSDLSKMTYRKHPIHEGFVIFGTPKKARSPRWMKITDTHIDTKNNQLVYTVKIAWWYVLWVKFKHLLKR